MMTDPKASNPAPDTYGREDDAGMRRPEQNATGQPGQTPEGPASGGEGAVGADGADGFGSGA